MNRLNIFLLIVVLGCALSAVSASNKQRQIFINVQRAQSEERQFAAGFFAASISAERVVENFAHRAVGYYVSEDAAHHYGSHAISEL